MNKKSNLFGDQSSSSRLRDLNKGTLNTVKQSYGAYYVKNETEKNSINSALSRVRAGGSVVPLKTRNRPIYPLTQCPDLPHTTGYQLCSSWPHFGGFDNSNRRWTPFLGSKTGVLKWASTINNSNYVITSSPVIDEYGSIYISYTLLNTRNTGYLAKFDKHGSFISSYMLPNSGINLGDYTNGCTPAIGNDGTVFFGTNLGNFYAVSVFGTQRWYYHVLISGQTSSIVASPVIDLDGTVYFGTTNNTNKYGRLFALTANGSPKPGWPFLTTANIFDETTSGIQITQSVAILKTNIYLCAKCYYSNGNYGIVYYISSSGSLIWHYTTIGLRSNAEIVSQPVISPDSNYVYISVKNLQDPETLMVALDAQTGEVAWTYVDNSFQLSNVSIALDSLGNLYFGGVFENNISALISIDNMGAFRWYFVVRNGYFSSQVIGSPVIDSVGNVYVSTSYVIRSGVDPDYVYTTYGEMYAVNSDGILVWNYTLDAGYLPVGSPVIDSSNTVYTAATLQGEGGYSNLFAFN